MGLVFGSPLMDVSASGLEDSLVSIPVADAHRQRCVGLRPEEVEAPVADATGRDMSASGLKRLIGIEAPVADAHRQGCVGRWPGGF